MKKKKKLSDQSKYKEAEELKFKIEKAKEKFIELKKKEVDENHKLEYGNLEENMMLELEDFNKYWDNKMNIFEEKSKNIEKMINERHIDQFKKLSEEMENYTPLIKPNHNYNVLKMTELRLKKIDKFLEAENIKENCDKIEKNEAIKLQEAKNKKFIDVAMRLEKTHNNEINVVKRKLQDEYNIMINQKEKEYEKLMTRFKTRKIELELQQHHEKSQNRDLNVIKQSKKIFILETANERFSIINNSTTKMDFYSSKLGQSIRKDSFILS